MKGEWRKSPYFRGGVALFSAIAAAILFNKIVTDFSGVMAIFSMIGEVLRPFVIGLLLAYLLSPIYDLVQRPTYKLFSGKSERSRQIAKSASKLLATVASITFLFGVVAALISMVIPQAYSSIVHLVETFPEKNQAFFEWVRTTGDRFGNGELWVESLVQAMNWVGETVTTWVKGRPDELGTMAAQVSLGIFGVIGTLLDVIVGIIICVYTLNSKALFAAQSKKVLYSMCKTTTANYIVHLSRYVNQTFGHFINGMFIDALLVGSLCFLGMTIMGMPYALLVSAIVGMFNVVPIFGPIVAALIGAFFVFLDDPFKALIFLVFVLILQQIDGNIVAPKILGEKTGIKSFWVIFAIVVGGGLFGFWGMIFGVPVFAVIYALFQKSVVHRLRKKQYPDDTESYYGLWEIDSKNGDVRYERPTDELDVPVRAKHKKE